MVHRALAEAIELFEVGLANCHRSEDRAQIERYLAALAPILAGAVLGKEVVGRLGQLERLFGHSWLIDQVPFEPALAKWREFRADYERFAVRGMTVNERLHVFSSTDDYDRAVAAQDVDAAEAILKKMYVDDDSIAKTVARIRGDA